MRIRKRSSEKSTFFPWEARGGVLRRLRLGRFRPFLLIAAFLAFVVMVGLGERSRAGVRLTRARLLFAHQVVTAYMAGSDGHCPETLEQAVAQRGLPRAPSDAWGHPLRLICPSTQGPDGYELMSDGPDGRPGGLDRIQ
jgi:general secretion pathway protein G